MELYVCRQRIWTTAIDYLSYGFALHHISSIQHGFQAACRRAEIKGLQSNLKMMREAVNGAAGKPTVFNPQGG
jgi:hypothetical protein